MNLSTISGAREASAYNFAYLDEQTKRMIRRGLLKAVAIPGDVYKRQGYSYLAGRDKRRAELAARAAAHLQGSDQARGLDGLIEPLARQQREQRLARAAKTATTQVEFFTLVRGED